MISRSTPFKMEMKIASDMKKEFQIYDPRRNIPRLLLLFSLRISQMICKIFMRRVQPIALIQEGIFIPEHEYVHSIHAIGQPHLYVLRIEK